jgi:hypothetical protein
VLPVRTSCPAVPGARTWDGLHGNGAAPCLEQARGGVELLILKHQPGVVPSRAGLLSLCVLGGRCLTCVLPGRFKKPLAPHRRAQRP